MAETPFTIGADVSCTDGACGKVTQVVVDPVARAVTHLVVDRHGKARLAPLDLVDASEGEIRLRCTRAEFKKLQLAEIKQCRSRLDSEYATPEKQTVEGRTDTTAGAAKGWDLSQISHRLTGRYGTMASMPDTRQDADLRIRIPAHWADARL